MMQGMLIRSGADAVTASQRALAMLDGQVGLQASMLGFDRAFFLAGLVFCASIPLVVLLDDGRKRAAPGAKQENQEHMAVEILTHDHRSESEHERDRRRDRASRRSGGPGEEGEHPR